MAGRSWNFSGRTQEVSRLIVTCSPAMNHQESVPGFQESHSRNFLQLDLYSQKSQGFLRARRAESTEKQRGSGAEWPKGVSICSAETPTWQLPAAEGLLRSQSILWELALPGGTGQDRTGQDSSPRVNPCGMRALMLPGISAHQHNHPWELSALRPLSSTAAGSRALPWPLQFCRIKISI